MKLVVFCFTLRKHKDLQLRSLPLNPGLESINVGWLWHDSENIFWGMHGIYSNLEMTLILILTLILTVVPANMEQRRCLLMLIKQICLCFSCCNLSDSMRSSSSVRFWGIKWPWDVTSLCEGKLQLRIQLFQIFFILIWKKNVPEIFHLSSTILTGKQSWNHSFSMVNLDLETCFHLQWFCSWRV